MDHSLKFAHTRRLLVRWTMQHAPSSNDGRYPPSGRPESVYSSPAYGPPATAYTQYTQNIPAQSEPRSESFRKGQVPPSVSESFRTHHPLSCLADASGPQFRTMTAAETSTEPSTSTSPVGRRTRKRKTPPTQANDTASSSSLTGGQYEFETSAQGAAEHPHHQQQQSTSQFALDPGMQTFVSTDGMGGGGEDDHGEDQGGSQGRSPASSRPVNPSKRAEQNRKAQRAFRERRDA